ncbi:MAG: DUF2442 domain-containing protein [Planctomycetes bacterium]|nr:DUF2442 domain-containing protein [Planctomycetota bacterium]MBI3845233.1 DUF2442 domain-containing protein [Planctomycetota bacterium]
MRSRRSSASSKRTGRTSRKGGTSTLPDKLEPLAVDVRCTRDCLRVALADGREISVPVAWFPRLSAASSAQRTRWRLIGGGIGIHWPGIDEDISVESLLAIK